MEYVSTAGAFGEKREVGGGGTASSLWYVAGRCWPLRLCHIYLTQLNSSHHNTQPGRDSGEMEGEDCEWGAGL